MAYTKTQLVNMAFQQLGVSTQIDDVDSDDTMYGNYAKNAWDATIPSIIEAYNFNFAVSRVPLSQVADPDYVIPSPWAVAYQIPLYATGIYSIWPRSRYEINGQYILAQVNPAFLDIRTIPPVSSWPPSFSMYIMWSLAVYMAPVVSKSDKLTENAEKQCKLAQGLTLTACSQRQTTKAIRTAPYIACRFNGGLGNNLGYGDGW